MVHNIMLYGATGYSGRLIASEMKLVSEDEPGAYRMILAGRDGNQLRALAQELEMECRVFGLDRRSDSERGLDGMHVVINAAGPFAWTAERLVLV